MNQNKKKLLFIPSYSMRSYTSDKWLLSRDAHATQFNALAKRLREDYEIHVHVPAKGDHVENGLFIGCQLISDAQYGKNIAQQRELTNWMHTFKSGKDDYTFILTGHPEYCAQLREIFPKAKIAAILTHGPLINLSYLNSLPLDAADVIFYNFARDILPRTFQDKSFTKLQPLYNYADWDLYRMGEETFRGKVPRSVLFPSRLDESRYDVDHWKWLLGMLTTKGYTVWITDPNETMGSLSRETLQDEKRLIHRRQESRSAWFEILSEAETVIIPYSIERTLSVTAMEALALKCKLVTIKCNGHFRHLNAAYSLEGEPSSEALLEAISKSYDEQPRIYAQKYFIDQQYCRRFQEAYIEKYASQHA